MRLHVIDKIFPASDLLNQTEAVALKIVEKAPQAIKGAKVVIQATADQTLIAGLREEVDEFLKLFGTKDREEGMKAFMQKRKPTWENA